MTDYRRLRVALLGAGAVGSQVAALLLRHGDELVGNGIDALGEEMSDLSARLFGSDEAREAMLAFLESRKK